MLGFRVNKFVIKSAKLRVGGCFCKTPIEINGAGLGGESNHKCFVAWQHVVTIARAEEVGAMEVRDLDQIADVSSVTLQGRLP